MNEIDKTTKKNNSTTIAFKILEFLQKHPQKYIIKQDISFQELSKEITNKEIHTSNNIPKLISKEVTLLGLNYEILINENLQESFLIFATPLEHLLSLNILLEKETTFLRIEYEHKMCLILTSHLQYLHKQYTILEEIEVELLDGYYYKKSFNSPFLLFLPQTNQDELYSITLVNTPTKILFNPHINYSQIEFMKYFPNIHLFNIITNDNYFELLQKYLNYHPTTKTSQFLGAEIIQSLTTSYPLYYLKEKPTISNILTTYDIILHSNYTHSTIQSHPKQTTYPLPLFLTSDITFVEIKDENDFLKITGIPYTFNDEMLHFVLIKDKYSRDSLWCHLYLNDEIINKIENISTQCLLLSYSSIDEYYIKKLLLLNSNNNTYYLNPRIQLNNCNLLKKLLHTFTEFIKQQIITHTSFPHFEEQSILSKALFSYCFKLNMLMNIEEKIYLKEHILEQLQLIILEIGKIFSQFSCTKKELFELCYILKQIFELCTIYGIDISKEFTFFKEMKLFSQDKEFLNKHVFTYYDEIVSSTYLQTLYNITILLPFIKKNKVYVIIKQENSNEIYSLISKNVTILKEDKNNHIHLKTLFSNELIELLYY